MAVMMTTETRHAMAPDTTDRQLDRVTASGSPPAAGATPDDDDVVVLVLGHGGHRSLDRHVGSLDA